MATVTSKKIVKSERSKAIDTLCVTLAASANKSVAGYKAFLVLSAAAKAEKANITEYINAFNVKYPHLSKAKYFTAADINAAIIANDLATAQKMLAVNGVRDAKHAAYVAKNAAKQKAERLARKASKVIVTPAPLSAEVIAQINEAGYVAA